MFGCAQKAPLLPVKKKETNYLIWFYIILYNFIASPGFLDTEQILDYKVAIE